MKKNRVNKDTNKYCWLWSASCYEQIEEERKKWIEEKVKNNSKSKNKKK